MRPLRWNIVIAIMLSAVSVVAPAEEPSADRLVAIDVLLDPDTVLVQAARSVNSGLRANFPDGFALDADHAPHVTILQGFIRQGDLQAVSAAIARLVSQYALADLHLEATGYYDIPFGESLGLAGVVVRPTEPVLNFHRQVIASLKPYLAERGSEDAFVPTQDGSPITPDTVNYVNEFRRAHADQNYNPHVTVGIGTREYLDRLKGLAFDEFTSSPVSVSIYQLGNLGTAQRKLWTSAEPLSSWNDGDAKQTIVSFVEKVTTPGSVDYVPPAERIAVFDNDGCLWAEQPMYFQLFFALDRIKALAPQHPEWKDTEPFKSVLAGDVNAALAGGDKAILELVAASHAGMTADEFTKIVADWLATAKHPKTGKRYTEMIYQPMLELLDYLRANGFKTFIVSGGGIEFMRPWTERVYGIPPEQVVGSSIKTKFEMRDGVPVLVRLPEINFIDDKEGKPIGIHSHIGRRPIAAFGNSDGDLQMLQYTTSGPGARFGLIVHHTDADREWAYDRDSHIGQLNKALDEAASRGWTVVDMQRDWNLIYPRAR